MHVNNEIGVCRISRPSAKCAARGNIYHADATQSVGLIDLSQLKVSPDVLLRSVKFYGPKGIGALYVRRKPRIALKRRYWRRARNAVCASGTLPVQIVGMGEAYRIAKEEMETEMARLRGLRKLSVERYRKDTGRSLPERRILSRARQTFST